MKKVLIILISLLVCSGISMAATLTATQKQEIISKINKAVSASTSISCNFTQTKYLSLLNDKMVSEGKMYYKNPNKLRWEYTSPYKYLFIFNGSKVYVGNNNRKDVIDTNSNKIFKEVARIMMSTVTGTALSNTTDFSIDVADGGSVWQVTLIPKKKDLKMIFERVKLNFAKNNSMITEISIFEKNKDRTIINLKNVNVNKAVNENLFAIPK